MIKSLDQRQQWVRLVVLLVVGIPFVIIFSPFFIPILLAVFFAFGLEPVWQKFRIKRKQKKLFPFFLIGFWFFFLFLPFVIITLKVVRLLQTITSNGLESSPLLKSIISTGDAFYKMVTSLIEKVGLESGILPSIDEVVSKVSPFIISKTTSFLTSLPQLGLSVLVFFAMLIVFVTQADRIGNFFSRSKILPSEEIDWITDCLQQSCYLIITSTLLIGMLQAFIVALGASIFGFSEFFLVFVITLILSFIPVVGAAPVAFVLAITSFISGDNGYGVGLIIVGITASGLDNLIKPMLLARGEKSLHPIVSLLGLIGAILVFGLPGLLLGPLLLQTSVELLPKLSGDVLSPKQN